MAEVHTWSLRRLNGLVSSLGENAVAETLGVDLETLRLILQGNLELDDDAAEMMASLCQVLADASGWQMSDVDAEEVDISVDPVRGDVSPDFQPVGVDLDMDGVPDLMLPRAPSMARPGLAWSELHRRRARSMWNSLAMAKMVRFRVGMPPGEVLAAIRLEVRIELALIACFNESLPEPGETWDGRRRYREIEIRLRRLRWVDQQLEREYGGLKGAWNRLLGRKYPTGRDLYEKMVTDSDDMLLAMSEDREVDIMDEVMKYQGLPAGNRFSGG